MLEVLKQLVKTIPKKLKPKHVEKNVERMNYAP